MSDFTAEKIFQDFRIDGNVEKEPWISSAWSRPFVDMASGGSADFETRISILWSDQFLYVAFKIEEPSVSAQLHERDSLIFLENDVELFIDGGDCYYELEINALNTIYEVFFIWRDAFPDSKRFPPEIFDITRSNVYTFGGDYDRTGEWFWTGTHPRKTRWAVRDFDLAGLQTAVRIDGKINDPSTIDKGWSVEIAIPWESLKMLAGQRSVPPNPGENWKFFLGRFDKKVVDGTERQPHPASALRAHGVYDTHQPEQWSQIEFR